MNSFLTSKLSAALEKAGKKTVEFKELPADLSIEQINFHGVRGSIRLINQNVLTPKDVQELKSSVLNFNFGA